MKRSNMWEGVAQITQVGLNILVPILGMTLVGNWLDQKFSAKGIVLVIFILVGVAAGFANLFRLGKK